jgi:hypothetical protein
MTAQTPTPASNAAFSAGVRVIAPSPPQPSPPPQMSGLPVGARKTH